MKTEWLTRSHGSHLILFFAGWGMDPRPFQPVPTRDADLLIFFDYAEPDLPHPLDEIISEYRTVTLLAWSLGVCVAARVCEEQQLTPDKAVAINGTPFPADDRYGIPTERFDATIAGLSSETLLRFYRRMCKDRDLLQSFLRNAPRRKIPALDAELRALRQLPSATTCPFDEALVSDQDHIIPVENQLACWQKLGVTVRQLPGPHFPFYSVEQWEDLF